MIDLGRRECDHLGVHRRFKPRLLIAGMLALVGGSATGQPPAEQPESARASDTQTPEREPIPHRGHHSGLIAVDRHGLLVVETHEGALLRVDPQGKLLATLRFSPGLGELVHDGGDRVYLADRSGDRVVRIATGDGTQLTEANATTLREPFGLALTPDGNTLLVTSVADHALVVLDANTLQEQWRVELAAEPRPVAVSADGRQAVVGFLTSGALAFVDLRKRTVSWRSLDPRDHVIIDEETFIFENDHTEETFEHVVETMRIGEARSRYRVPVETGRRYARNVARVAYVGDQALALHQLATPQLRRIPPEVHEDSYGGGSVSGERVPPLVYRMALIDEPGTVSSQLRTVTLDLHLPRALAYDEKEDRLFVGGYGNDEVWVISEASQPSAYRSSVIRVDDGTRCGIDGLAFSNHDDLELLWIHCEFTRSLIRVGERALNWAPPEQWLRTEPLLPDGRGPGVLVGAELFRRGGDHRLSEHGALACAACHPEGRADGLTWRLGSSILQVPILAGRINETEPYKWDGQDATLADSLRHTIGRLGGHPDSFSEEQLEGLAAYLRSLPPPRSPTPADAQAIARGRAVFEATGCDACHLGKAFTDRERHALATSLGNVDTPSLLGLAQSAPYYHDGSAVNLEALVDNRSTIHDMADMSQLSAEQKADLVAYLGSL